MLARSVQCKAGWKSHAAGDASMQQHLLHLAGQNSCYRGYDLLRAQS
jgi:hypothetical protein